MSKDEQQNEQMGLRFNKGKLRHSLLPVEPINDLIRVLMYGSNKYDDYNWRKGLKWTDVYDCAMRHSKKFMAGRDLDDESGLYHAAHAAINWLFILEFYRTHPELDDRPHKGKQ